MKKQLNTESVCNELQGSSLFFRRPQVEPTAERSAPLPVSDPASGLPAATVLTQPAVQSQDPTVGPDHPGRTIQAGRSGRRDIIRHPFELYRDQVEHVRWLAGRERMLGGRGSMSAMVRDALDAYLTTQPRPEV